MIRRPSGCMNGAKLAAPLRVTRCLFEPSASMTQMSRGPARKTFRARRRRKSARASGRLGVGWPGRRSSCRRREEGAAVVAGLVGEAADVGAVGVHGVDVDVAVAGGGEDDLRAVVRDGGLGVVPGVVREAAQVGAVGPGGVDVVGVEGPDVALCAVRRWRALGGVLVGGAVEDAVAGREEVGAGRTPRGRWTPCGRCGRPRPW
jgi:hypothetical protein